MPEFFLHTAGLEITGEILMALRSWMTGGVFFDDPAESA
jgi:hypothetical protein